MKDGTPYLINGLLIFAGWLAVRIICLLLVGYQLVTCPDITNVHYTMVYAIPIMFGGITILNFLWFYKITMGIVKVLFGGKPKTHKK